MGINLKWIIKQSEQKAVQKAAEQSLRVIVQDSGQFVKNAQSVSTFLKQVFKYNIREDVLHTLYGEGEGSSLNQSNHTMYGLHVDGIGDSLRDLGQTMSDLAKGKRLSPERDAKLGIIGSSLPLETKLLQAMDILEQNNFAIPPSQEGNTISTIRAKINEMIPALKSMRGASAAYQAAKKTTPIAEAVVSVERTAHKLTPAHPRVASAVSSTSPATGDFGVG